MKVRIGDIVDAIEMASDEFEFFYNRETGEIFSVGDPMLTGESEDGRILGEIEENWGRYERIPAKYDVNEYGVMEAFIEEEILASMQNNIKEAIRGRGAFRRFKGLMREMDLEEEWYAYRDIEYRRVAQEWCEENSIVWE